MKTALTAEELGLRSAVPPVGVAATVTPLGGMPRIYGHDLATKGLSLVFEEALELGEAPGVQPAAGFSVVDSDSLPDIGEVLHDDSGSRFNALQDRRGQNVVAIPSEALLTPSEASKVPLSGLRTVGLEITSKAKDTSGNFFPVSFPVKAIIRGNGRVADAQVNANSLTIFHKGYIWQFNDNMKVELAFAEDEVGGGSRVAYAIFGIPRCLKCYLGSAARGRHVHDVLLPVHVEGVQVVSWGAKQ